MTNVVMRVVRATKFAGVLALALAAAACANRPYDPQAGGSAPPGRQQDLVVNVGDRVFFESDSSELTSQSIATQEKQAHDFLRQGTSGRGVQRHFMLVAEPARGNGAQYQLVNEIKHGGRGQPAPSGAGCVLGRRNRLPLSNAGS